MPDFVRIASVDDSAHKYPFSVLLSTGSHSRAYFIASDIRPGATLCRVSDITLLDPLPVSAEPIEGRIIIIRGHRVMLDGDLAVLYEMKAIALRQQVKRNKDRFPTDFMFQLSRIFGKEYPDNSMPGITVSYIRADSNTVIVVRKKDGEEVGRSVDVVSRDGKTLTRSMSGNVNVVYKKQ